MIPISAIKDKHLSDAAFRLYALLLLLRFDMEQKPQETGGGVMCKQETLAAKINMSFSKFKRTLLILEEYGYCKRRVVNNTLTEITVIAKPLLSEQAAFELAQDKEYTEEWPEIDF